MGKYQEVIYDRKENISSENIVFSTLLLGDNINRDNFAKSKPLGPYRTYRFPRYLFLKQDFDQKLESPLPTQSIIHQQCCCSPKINVLITLSLRFIPDCLILDLKYWKRRSTRSIDKVFAVKSDDRDFIIFLPSLWRVLLLIRLCVL